MNIRALVDIVGSDYFSQDDDELTHYGQDFSQLISPKAQALVKPSTVEQVQSIVQWANQEKVALIPSGGRTGLSGGATAIAHEVIVSMERLNQISHINTMEQTVTVEAGVTTAVLQEHASSHHLFYPVDFASSGSSQIGGNIATNAGGIKVIRWGMTRDHILGLKVVTGRGDILELNNGLIKNATGYDLRHLFIGSEGTLGFIVEANIQLTKMPNPLNVLLLGIQDLKFIDKVLERFRQKMQLTAFEFFSQKALHKVQQHHTLPSPFQSEYPFYVLIEFEENESSLDLVSALFENCLNDNIIQDGIISQSEQQAQTLWQMREFISESISHEHPYKNDIAVRPSLVNQLLEQVDAVVTKHYPDFEVIWFGHIGDGNLHLNILKPENISVDDFMNACKKVNPMVYQVVKNLRGSISAEHGIGLLKKDYLHYSRSLEEISIFKQIKSIFDPNHIMNPGKIF